MPGTFKPFRSSVLRRLVFSSLSSFPLLVAGGEVDGQQALAGVTVVAFLSPPSAATGF
jgi:hypothetical protein